MRLTIVCPSALASDANQLARCLGLGPDDDRTFGDALWLDAAGNAYACASQEVGAAWQVLAQASLRAPDWGCDLAAAGRAQAKLVFWTPALPGEVLEVTPASIWVAADVAPGLALQAMGVLRPETED